LTTVGIVCEYNPFHGGHKLQFDKIRRHFGEETAIVCAMSGQYVQRGEPAVFDKSLRARAALESGADLVLELPLTYALRSAEGFAAGGVEVLSPICDYLCFGSETGDAENLMKTAEALLSEQFPPFLKEALESGRSFPAARAEALSRMGLDGGLLNLPNDILAVEYCKAILSQNTPMRPFPIRRGGSYHAQTPDRENPSATSLRKLLAEGSDIAPYVPEAAAAVFRNAPCHTLEAGERAILSKLRTMTDAEFEALPYGSEGLWRKFMHNCRKFATLEEILTATKSKRYTRTRLDRMLMCAYLGIDRAALESPAPYTRILAFNDRGRRILKGVKKDCTFVNAGQIPQHPYWELEKRASDFYGLFCVDGIEPPGTEEKRRIYYQPTQKS
jgi:predicted nucleotidyltransferase